MACGQTRKMPWKIDHICEENDLSFTMSTSEYIENNSPSHVCRALVPFRRGCRYLVCTECGTLYYKIILPATQPIPVERSRNERYDFRQCAVNCFTQLNQGCVIMVLYLVGQKKKWYAANVLRVKDGEDPNSKIVDLYFDEDNSYVDDFELHSDRFNLAVEAGWKFF